METIKIFGVFYFISFAFMYYLSYKYRLPVTIPGDVFIKKGPRTIYIPIASALLLAILLFVVLRALFKF